MAIAKGQDWGRPGRLPADAPVAADDRAAADLVGGAHQVIGLAAGDLARTLGIRMPYGPDRTTQIVPVDAVEIELDDGTTHTCIAHALIGRPLVDRTFVALMNAAFIGARNVAPRAHPGDGRVDVVHFDLPVGDRIEARRRMITGSHLPHPGIEVRRQASGRLELSSRRPVRIDGERCGRSRTLAFRVLPAAIEIAV